MDPRIELGTGFVDFVPLPDDGGTIEIIYGPQGGWHFNVTSRFWDIAPDELTLTYEVRHAGEAEIVNYVANYMLNARRVIDVGDHFVRVGDRTVLDIRSPQEVAGRTMQIEVRALAADGTELARDGRVVTAVDP